MTRIPRTVGDLTTATGLTAVELQQLTQAGHYRHFTRPKRRGGVREISVPSQQLADVQRWVLREVLSRLEDEDQAHGFVPGRSTVTAATPHVGKRVVVNLDLRDFFPSIDSVRVSHVFRRLGCAGSVAELLTLLCTEPHEGRRRLPQGACTSPTITNAVCRRLDQRLVRLCGSQGFAYTRYADDLSLSGNEPYKARRLLRATQAIIQEEGFFANPDKTRTMKRGRQQEVTGLTVTEKTATPRWMRRRLRAMLHNAALDGLESQNRNGAEGFDEYLTGVVAYVTMADPASAEEWREKLGLALDR